MTMAPMNVAQKKDEVNALLPRRLLLVKKRNAGKEEPGGRIATLCISYFVCVKVRKRWPP